MTYEDLIARTVQTEAELVEATQRCLPADISDALEALRHLTIRVQKVLALAVVEKLEPSFLYDMAPACQSLPGVLMELVGEMGMASKDGEFVLALVAVHERDDKFLRPTVGSREVGIGGSVILGAGEMGQADLLCCAIHELRLCCTNLVRYEAGADNSVSGNIRKLLAHWRGAVTALLSAGGQLTPEHEREILRLALAALAAVRRSGWTGSAESLGIQPWTAKEAKGVIRAFRQPVSPKRRGR
jgi:hypothetical protein